MIIGTPRLRLRPLVEADMEASLAMTVDPDVMRYVSPTPIPRVHAEAAAMHYRRLLETEGYGYWAIDVHGPRVRDIASRRVMERLEMTHKFADDFDHPHTLGTPFQCCRSLSNETAVNAQSGRHSPDRSVRAMRSA